MNKNITLAIVLSNLIFYSGIFFIVHLFFIDDNSPKSLIAILLIVAGIIGSGIPDAMINIGFEQIKISLVRYDATIKYFMFVVFITFLDSYTIIVLAITGTLFIADLVILYFIFNNIYYKNITIEMFIERLKNFDTSQLDKIIKYLWINNFAIIFFMGIHLNFTETTIMLIICIIVHFFVSEIVIKDMKFERKINNWKIRILLWGIEICMLLLAYNDKNIAVYILFAEYYVLVTDLVMERKTSIYSKKQLNLE